jgi:hypothetical protein
VPVFGIERVPVSLINSLAYTVVAFETKVKVGVVWAATSFILPFGAPITKIRLIRNKVAITQTLTALFSILLFFSFRPFF